MSKPKKVTAQEKHSLLVQRYQKSLKKLRKLSPRGANLVAALPV